MQKLAILGGTFNPVHWGHLLMAETALSQLPLDQVLWVPTHYPPHKSQTDLLNFQHRLEMVKRAIAPHPAFILLPLEPRRAGFSYAIETLTELQTLYPNSQWHWILGLDAFQSLPHWYRRQDLVAQCHWLVAPRLKSSNATQIPHTFYSSSPTWAAEQLDVAEQLDTIDYLCQQVAQQMVAQSISISWQRLQMPLVEISSSLIRQHCRDRRSIRYLVPESVRTYITTHNFYH